ncbi:hypothetical protein [Rosettibacter firmus]|uniref:hypothetical protein n=1 Tax=Rosettibacter firmus TaxID=3111522 RepID=UPI00336BF123
MAQLSIKLKQHSPLIHFQFNQPQAFLRMSEVKPKLDRFLVDYFKKNRIDYKKWLIGSGEHDALNYSMKVCNEVTLTYYLPMPLRIKNKKSNNLKKLIKDKIGIDIDIISPTPFFANADKIKFIKDRIDPKRVDLSKISLGIFTDERIRIIIKSWDEVLLNKIKENISVFFLLNNFGTRQDKGFGSFSVESINNETVQLDKNILLKHFFKKSKISYKNFSDLFEFILDEYQKLKSGKNYPTYTKSELFNYFITQGIIWEKRYLKQKILNKDLWSKKPAPIDIDDAKKIDYNEWDDRQQNNYKYIRALLGLAEHFEFNVIKEERDKNGKWIRTSNKDERYKYFISVEHNPSPGKPKIERFPSPIFFKVLNGCVYIGTNDSYKEILDEGFSFKLLLEKDEGKTEINLGSLKVPDNFDLKDFLQNHLSENWVNI